MRVRANLADVAILSDIDALNGHLRPGEQGARQRALGAGEREHRAVMIGIGVDVEQTRGSSGRERSADRVNCRLSTTLGDIWDG